MQLGDLLDLDLLAQHVRDGYVSVRAHPEAPLEILNYTAAAQYAGAWDDVTWQCRGLVVRQEDSVVVARPWPKFHNYGEHEEGTLDLDARVTVTDKLDGSLGILYPAAPGQWAVATRGSFESEQALRGTRIWRDVYSDMAPVPGWTFLFEIIYPANRIVVDYGALEDLVLLGAVNIATGETIGPYETFWPGMRVRNFEVDTLRDALELPPRENAEGLVIRYHDTGQMLKIKQDDYVELHRIVTGLSERAVWERLGAGETVADICTGLPDEFAAWVQKVAAELETEAEIVLYAATDLFEQIKSELSPADEDFSRKDFAEKAKEYKAYTPYLFMLLDGQDPRAAIWRSAKP